MDERYISEQGNTITINTLMATAFEGIQPKSYLDGRVAIEEVFPTVIPDPPYSKRRTVFRIEIDPSLKDEKETWKNFAIHLICRQDEYFYSIQEDYLKLLDDKKINDTALLAGPSPHMELLVHESEGETRTAKLTKGQARHLLSHAHTEVKESFTNRFYVVLNKFIENASLKESGGTRFLEFDRAAFRELPNGEMPDLPGSEPHRIAIIVHGLASRIGEAYNDLAQHLERAGYHVFGFDYLTVNQPIADNARQLANCINQLKKNYPKSELLVVAHSMGGLVARSAEVTHGAEIDQLIMAGTPNNGSVLLSNQHLVRSLFLFASVLQIIPIKFEDYRQLVVSNEWRGLEDLTNKSAFIDELNTKDRLHYSKKYFSLVGKFEGLPHDLLVHNENMTKINETNMPSIPLDKHHFEYFRGTGWYEPLDQALLYLK